MGLRRPIFQAIDTFAHTTVSSRDRIRVTLIPAGFHHRGVCVGAPARAGKPIRAGVVGAAVGWYHHLASTAALSL